MKVFKRTLRLMEHNEWNIKRKQFFQENVKVTHKIFRGHISILRRGNFPKQSSLKGQTRPATQKGFTRNVFYYGNRWILKYFLDEECKDFIKSSNSLTTGDNISAFFKFILSYFMLELNCETSKCVINFVKYSFL